MVVNSPEDAMKARRKWKNIFDVTKEKAVRPESYTQWNYPSELKKSRHSQIKKNKDNLNKVLNLDMLCLKYLMSIQEDM